MLGLEPGFSAREMVFSFLGVGINTYTYNLHTRLYTYIVQRYKNISILPSGERVVDGLEMQDSGQAPA